MLPARGITPARRFGSAANDPYPGAQAPGPLVKTIPMPPLPLSLPLDALAPASSSGPVTWIGVRPDSTVSAVKRGRGTMGAVKAVASSLASTKR